MKKVAFLLITILFVMLCDIPVISESDTDYEVYREYRDELYLLQKDMAHLYMELHQEKNPHAVYQHILQVTEKTAQLMGEAERASQDIDDRLQISVQDYLEILLRLGLSEQQKKNLVDLGYTEDDLHELRTWLLYYNDYYHHAATGFTPEEVNWFYSMGLTDDDIAQLQITMQEHYTRLHTASQMVKQQQKELLYIQVSLSIAALQQLLTLETDKGKDKESKSLLDAEEKLLQAIGNVSQNQSSLEQIKAFSKQVYKEAEHQIRKGEEQYYVDFFVGLQIHCGAVTALHGDLEFGLAEIHSYEYVVSECITTPERRTPSPAREQSVSVEPSSFKTDFVGHVEELDETNNMSVVHVFVKAPDTNLWQSLALLIGFVSTNFGGVQFSLSAVVEFLTAGITVVSIAIGTIGAFFLLVVTAPTVGYEWPPAVPGWIEGDEIVIIVEGSYGQGHIAERAESGEDPCIRSSHQAILDDKYMIQDIVMNALKLFRNEGTGQYIYYYVDNAGKEWAVFIRKYAGKKFYELRTAYRVDCKPPYKCGGEEFETIIEKWICEGFKLISLW